MGIWSATKRYARRGYHAVRSRSGKLARTGAVGAAGIGATIACGGNPVCGIVAAAATDEFLGEPIERTTRRAIDKTGQKADAYLDYLRGEGEPVARPPALVTSIEGGPVVTSIEDAPETDATPYVLAAAATTIGAAALALVVLRKTGRI